MTGVEESFSKRVLFELDSIRFTEAPILVSEEARYFVTVLADTMSTDGQTLYKFVMSKSLYVLRDAAIRLMLDSVDYALFAECSSLAIQKENAIAVQNFELAARLRDQQYAERAKLRERLPDPTLILPVHIAQLFRVLGFDGPVQSRNCV